MPEGLVNGLTFEYIHEIHPTAGAVQRMLPNPETGRTMVNGRVQMYAGSINTMKDGVLTILGGGRGRTSHIFAFGQKLTGYNLQAHALPFKDDWAYKNYKGNWKFREVTYENGSWSYRDGVFSK